MLCPTYPCIHTYTSIYYMLVLSVRVMLVFVITMGTRVGVGGGRQGQGVAN